MKRALSVVGVCAFLVLMLVTHNFFGRWSQWAGQIASGVELGTYFGATASSAVWLVFGVVGYARRLWIWLLCGLGTTAAVTIKFWMVGALQGDMPFVCALMGAGAMVQSSLIAGLLWMLGKATGARLRHVDELPTDVGGGDQQFGIRAVLVVTGLIAAALGGIRLVLEVQTPEYEVLAIYGYLILCNLFVVVPLIVAPLLRRFALACTLVALAFVFVITALEVSGLNRFEASGNGMLVFWPLNMVQVGWVLLALHFVRRGGYRLSAAASVQPRTSAAQPA